MACNEIPTQSAVPLVWEEHELFPPLNPENCSEGEIESSDNNIIIPDHRVLDCTHCSEPLKPPIFQCFGPHVCCFSCNKRLNNNCPKCLISMGFHRCFTMEKIVSSMKVTCTNKRYGCNVIKHYYELKEHEQTCFHHPCYCPYSNCFSNGCKRFLRKHMRDVHKEHIIDFRYGNHFRVVLPKTCTSKVLAEQDYIFYLHKKDEGLLGAYSLFIVCMRASHLNVQQFWHEIKVGQLVNSSEVKYLQLLSKVENCIPKGDTERCKFYLSVPLEFCRPNGDIHVFVCIKRVQSNDTF